MMFSVLDSQEDITCNSATLRACSLRWSFSIYQLQPTSTHFNKKYQLQFTSTNFNLLQPTSTHLIQNFIFTILTNIQNIPTSTYHNPLQQKIPISTHFNLPRPTSPFYQPQFTNNKNMPYMSVLQHYELMLQKPRYNEKPLQPF